MSEHKKKKIQFTDTDIRHAELKIRLERENLTQADFFRACVSGMSDNDKDLMKFIRKYKEEKSIGRKRDIKISKKEDKIFGYDELKKTKSFSNSLNYFVRFHIYPNTKIVKTMAGNSILISLSNGEGWSLLSETNKFKIEKNIFLGNKNKIINNESISMSGEITKEIFLIKWIIEKVS